jgi:Family of unknown function (DUF5689)/Domain of unknown function (DUF5017)
MKKLFILISIVTVIMACNKEPDSPPENILNQANAVTIDTLRAWQANVSPNGLSISADYHVYGIITMDESDGNLYKNLYMQDHTAAIQIRMTSTSDYAVGDSIRINLKGAYLSEYSGVIQLDSIDPDLMIIRQSAGNVFMPQAMNMSDVTVADEGKLIIIDSVQFQLPELVNTYADNINQSSENRMLEECSGNTIIVRTSGFANYAGQTVKQGNGSITAIVSRFGSELQLFVRSLDELTLDGTRCAGQILNKDFDDDDIYSGGWTTFEVTGPATPTLAWVTSSAGGAPSPFATFDNFDSGTNYTSENWLISPSLDLSSTSNPSLSFINAYNYSGDPLSLMISTNYSGTGDPNAAVWTDLTSLVTWDTNTSTWVWTNSGAIDLSGYLQSGVFIAFRYTGNNSSGSTWEIDDIIING